jgi:small subunit ribosomal protein S8
MFIDPIADLIIRIKNASRARHPSVNIVTSKLTSAILAVLKSEGYIEDYEIKKSAKNVKQMTVIKLKYKEMTPTISGIRQISKPGLRVYQEAKFIPRVLNGLGVAVISTSQGVVSDKYARAHKLGGEVIAYVW